MTEKDRQALLTALEILSGRYKGDLYTRNLTIDLYCSISEHDPEQMDYLKEKAEKVVFGFIQKALESKPC